MKFANPFRYPIKPLRRKHGPQGYSRYSQHRPWLRDEFDFRCVYCLKRETWAFQGGEFELDHQVAQSIDQKRCRDYTNLVYSCGNCNRRKGAKPLPSPDDVVYGECMKVLPDGRIIALNEEGERIIDELALDGKNLTSKRAQWIRSIRSHQEHDRSLFLLWMGFPEDMPDLANVKPAPKRNTRPQGIQESWLKMKRPEFFE
jgi:hypothetical protein